MGMGLRSGERGFIILSADKRETRLCPGRRWKNRREMPVTHSMPVMYALNKGQRDDQGCAVLRETAVPKRGDHINADRLPVP